MYRDFSKMHPGAILGVFLFYCLQRTSAFVRFYGGRGDFAGQHKEISFKIKLEVFISS
jgi:hypothetical protein